MIKKLFEPVSIGSLELKNRIVMTPMAVLLGSETGTVSQRQIDYFVERAKNGAGLITVESACVDSSKGTWGAVAQRIDDNRFITGYTELVESLQIYGAKVTVQFSAAGRTVPLAMTGGKPPVSASAIPGVEPGVTTRALEIAEIDGLVDCYGEAAKRARIAGFDAINISAAFGYLVNQFLSPLYNKRTDEYGGSLENRMRLAIRIVRRIKDELGKSFPIIWELNCDELTEGGITLKEAKVMAQMLEQTGVDAFRTGRATYEKYHLTIPPAALPRGYFVPLAAGLKEVVKTAKVWVEGRINDPELAEEILQANKADLVGFGRAFLADPEWPRKVAAGHLDDVRKCIGCNRCVERIFSFRPAKCTVNAAMGRERDYQLTPAGKPRRVVVVGGGAAGMEAARVAAARGHKVTLFEKESKLGGQLNLASIAPHKEETKTLLDYLPQQLRKLGVDIRLGEEATIRKINALRPEVVIIATGAAPLVPKIPGIDRKNVCLGWDVLADKVKAGERVVIVGGGMVGCETAEFLAGRGKKVTIVEMLPDVANDVEPFTRTMLLQRLDEAGVKILTNARLEEVVDRGIIYSENFTKKTIDADTVVLALGSVPNKDVAARLKGKVPELHSVGDCAEPGKLLEAIHAGYHCGRLV